MSINTSVSREPFWSLPEEETLKSLGSSLEGLTLDEVAIRKKIFGQNTLKDRKVGSLTIFLRQFKSPLIFILIFAAAVTAFLKEYSDCIIISLAVIVNTLLGFYQERKAENALSHLKSYLEERIRVVRAGQESEIDVKELVPGDILHLTIGSRVPADARVISVNDLATDESILTGESLPVDKDSETLPLSTDLDSRRNLLLAGTLVVQGTAKAVVYATGQQSELGKIATLLNTKKEDSTPLQKSISNLAWVMTVALLLITVLIFLLGIYRGQPFMDMFLTSVAMAVGAIPEGMPIALTIILAIGVERLAKKKTVVRKLIATETLGSVSLIMTDKTGTLTQAKMELSSIIPLEKMGEISASGITKPANDLFTPAEKNLISLALLHCDVTQENNGHSVFIGKPMEASIATESFKRALSVFDVKKELDPLDILPFNSKNKYSVCLIKKETPASAFLPWSEKEGIMTFFGAPEIILSRSTLSFEKQKSINALISELALSGKRLAAVGFKPVSSLQALKIDDPDSKIEFLGLIAFYDPPRPDIKNTLKRIEHLGLRIVMATGDHEGTAISLAKELGWEVTPAQVMDGNHLRMSNDEELLASLPQIKIFARVTPEDKLRIASLYKRLGEEVAMTGDGVNDAPSLREADVGVALGSGTDVAKDTADIVILDDNLNTIVIAIEEGRKIISNIKKTVIFMLASILDEIFLIGGSVILGLPLPLTATQILWVNFFSDAFPATSFAFEKQENESVGRTNRNNLIFDREVKTLIWVIGVLTSVMLFSIYFYMYRAGFDLDITRTFIFATFGLYTLFFVFSLKNLRQPLYAYRSFNNPYMIGGVALGLIMMLSGIYSPFLQPLLGTVSLPPLWLGLVFLFGFANILLAESTKYFFVVRKTSHKKLPKTLN